MKRIFTLSMAGLFLAACSSTQISTDFDSSANFSSYKTYAFTKDIENLPLDDLNKRRILSAIETEMAGKGFSKADNPDVWIDLKLKAEQKQTATTYGGGYGYGYRWGGGPTTTSIDNYTEGTLFVNMVDASKNELVWQGRAVKTIDPQSSASKREENIKYAIKQIFTKYPPKAK